jgi:hypothetical protein
VRYPLALDKQCRDGKAQLYDECSDQLVLFNNALERANAEGKVLLVSYGAEWCIWCHVLDAHLLGGKRTFRYTYGTAENPSERFSDTIYEHDDADGVNAEALRNFVTNEFVIVHIDCQYAPNGENVLTQTAAAEFAGNWIPFVFVVDKAGHYVASLDHNLVEKRRDTTDWYRGYNRTKLIEQLTRMRNQART